MTRQRSDRRPKTPNLSPRTLAAAAVGLALLGFAIAYGTQPRGAGAALIGGPFELVDANGRKVTDADFRGRPFLVYFGYTHCPDICPTTLAELSDVLEKLPGRPIKALFVSVDPERDSAKVMADYVSSFDSRIIGLSGAPDQIAAMEKGYRVYARKVALKDGDYTMDHTSIVYLMDGQGRFIEILDLDRPAEATAKELAKYF